MKEELTIHNIIDAMHTDPAGISARYGIPIRTVWSWCRGERKPPVYVLVMMSDIITLERMVRANGNFKEGLEVNMGADSGREQEAGKES